MKRVGLLIIFLSIGLFAAIAQTNTQKIEELFKGIIDFSKTNINDSRPISNVNLAASKQADTIFFLTKENLVQVMKEAKKYQHCVISVDRHTVVLVKSWSNCSKSGSWNYCMPYGEGFIQRDALVKKEDYIKNIIGVPDSQRRTVFLLKKK